MNGTTTAFDACPPKAEAVLKQLDETGLALIREPLAPEAYERLALELGEILLTTQIRIDSELLSVQAGQRARANRPSTYQAEALDFHTDNPAADFLSWHCLQQDRDGGTLFLLDTSDLPDHFTPAELKLLSSIAIEYSNMPAAGEREIMLRRPLLRFASGRYHVHYQSWLLLDDYSKEQGAVLDKFGGYLHYLAAEHRFQVRLEPRESLFIDNHRLLHGRGPLPPDSRRHLVRYFIRRHATG